MFSVSCIPPITIVELSYSASCVSMTFTNTVPSHSLIVTLLRGVCSMSRMVESRVERTRGIVCVWVLMCGRVVFGLTGPG